MVTVGSRARRGKRMLGGKGPSGGGKRGSWLLGFTAARVECRRGLRY